MKKIVLFIFLFFLFLIPIKAELTEQQANDLAFFAENFVNEGNKRISNDFPIFAYMEGQARTDGFKGNLYKINKDYNSINVVNDYKWAFDSSSFVAFIYYRTFNLIFTKSNISKMDDYSGLRLMSEAAEPYYVSDFLTNANDNKHFYYVIEDILVSQIDYNILRKGDLIVANESHIMIYIGEEKIVHATSDAISNDNLGMEITNLTSAYPNKTISVMRLKDHIIPENKIANLFVTWPDDNSISNLNNLRVKNDIPQITYTLSTNEWTNKLILTVTINDADYIEQYTFNDADPTFLKTKFHQFQMEITENGIYTVKSTDLLKNTALKEIEITNIDNIKPKIITLDVESKDNYSVLTIKGEDLESGLATNSYSFKDNNSWTNKNSFEIFAEGKYKVYVKDQVNNVFESEITVKFDDDIPPTINNVIYGENTEKGQKVTVTANDTGGSGILGFLVKESLTELSKNETWVITTSSNYTTFLNEGTYYLWVKDANGNISNSKQIMIEKADEIGNTNIFLSAISIIIIIVGIIFIRKYHNNKI